MKFTFGYSGSDSKSVRETVSVTLDSISPEDYTEYFMNPKGSKNIELTDKGVKFVEELIIGYLTEENINAIPDGLNPQKPFLIIHRRAKYEGPRGKTREDREILAMTSDEERRHLLADWKRYYPRYTFTFVYRLPCRKN